MALLKVFISSTCYDLGMVRAGLRNFIINLGHEPIMSDYHDVLFDPKDHTHESCVKEILNADAIILIIGSRYGGRAIPQAISGVDTEKLKLLSKNTKILENSENISITQLEVLKAIESNIPIFTFVDSRVLHDHLFYEKNKDKGIIDSIEFPSIERKETAIYIFEFINFLRLRSKNNSISEFNKISDIEEFLKKQWSGLLQRLLFEQRSHSNELKRIENLSEELKDIKSLVLSSISTSHAKEIGRGVLKYRRVIDFLLSFEHSNKKSLLEQNIDWDDLLKSFEIKEIKMFNLNSKDRPTIFLIKNDETFYELRPPFNFLTKFAKEWNLFRVLNNDVKIEIINAIYENDQHSIPMLRYRNQNFEEFIHGLIEERTSSATATIISTKTLNQQVQNDDDDGYNNGVNDRM